MSAILRAVSRAICSRRHVGPDRACRVEAILANIGNETIVIPDHGQPVSGKSGLKGYRDMLVAIRANGASLK